MRTRTLLLPLAGALLALTACDIEDFGGGSERYSQDFHYSYALKPGGRLSVESFNGSVDISGWDQDTVDISGSKYARTPELRDAIKIEIEHSPDSVYIRTVRPSDRRGNMGARYVIKVPRRTQLERVVSSNGAIHAMDVEGGARLKTSNGAVRAENLQGNLDAQTSNSSIEVQNLDGAATLRTSNGRVHADDVRGSLEANTSNSGIHVRLSKPDAGRPIKLGTSNGAIELTVDTLNNNDIRASTSNGGITVHLPANVNANLVADTSNSSINSDFDVQVQGSMSKRHLEGKLGAGGPTIELTTSNGGIRLLKM
jgi:Toastrack DUF4097